MLPFDVGCHHQPFVEDVVNQKFHLTCASNFNKFAFTPKIAQSQKLKINTNKTKWKFKGKKAWVTFQVALDLTSIFRQGH